MKAHRFWQQDIGAVNVIGAHRGQVSGSAVVLHVAHVNERGRSLEQGRAHPGAQMSDNVRENNQLFVVRLPRGTPLKWRVKKVQ